MFIGVLPPASVFLPPTPCSQLSFLPLVLSVLLHFSHLQIFGPLCYLQLLYLNLSQSELGGCLAKAHLFAHCFLIYLFILHVLMFYLLARNKQTKKIKHFFGCSQPSHLIIDQKLFYLCLKDKPHQIASCM